MMHSAVSSIRSSLKKIAGTPFQSRPSNSDIFDGWDVFVNDAISKVRKGENSYGWNDTHGALNYEAELASTIAGELFRRTGAHPNMQTLIQLERDAAQSIDYPRQLAFLVFKYEAECRESDTVLLT